MSKSRFDTNISATDGAAFNEAEVLLFDEEDDVTGSDSDDDGALIQSLVGCKRSEFLADRVRSALADYISSANVPSTTIGVPTVSALRSQGEAPCEPNDSVMLFSELH